ncbi:hypothetical protein NOVO_00410 [Rickettsiales bacterium Ac37b]|nr:hypothetical protein NOVO_00410 [Rickettsiales bacterium Ac37b]
MKNPIIQWSSAVYQRLANSSELEELGVKVFTYVPQDTKYPYIYLGEMIISDYSTKTTKGFNLINYISIYAEERGNKQAIILSHIVKELLESPELILKYYTLVSIRLLNCHISTLQERNICQSILKIKSIIEEI